MFVCSLYKKKCKNVMTLFFIAITQGLRDKSASVLILLVSGVEVTVAVFCHTMENDFHKFFNGDSMRN